MRSKILLSLIVIITLLSCQKQVKRIGVSIALSGDLDFYGKPAAEAIRLAQKDINTYLNEVSAWQVEFRLEDNQTKGEQALQILKRQYAAGIDKFIVGSSEALAACANFAAENNISLISFMSTDPSLAQKDNIFRLCPNDNSEAKAIVKYMQKSGLQTFVAIRRADSWGRNLSTACHYYFQEEANYVKQDVEYGNKAEINSSLKVLNSIIKNKIIEYGQQNVCVLVLGFDEVVTILKHAANYPYLRRVQWLGCSATAHNYGILKTPQAADFAVEVNLTSPLFALSNTEEKSKIIENIKKSYQQHIPDYAIIAYDAAWITAMADIIFKEDFEQKFPEYASDYFGITGNMELDESGDRKSAKYIYWQVTKNDNKYSFYSCCKYDVATDEFTNSSGGQ
jgi:ABC-type branched-subunit amino acid transport system substrate-binding protein